MSLTYITEHLLLLFDHYFDLGFLVYLINWLVTLAVNAFAIKEKSRLNNRSLQLWLQLTNCLFL